MVNKQEQETVFNLLKVFHGKENGISAKSATEYIYGKHTERLQRQLREVCSAINSNPEIDGLISTSGKIYVCKTEEECVKAMNTTFKTAFSYLRKARAMSKKADKQGQYEFIDGDTKIKIIYEEN